MPVEVFDSLEFAKWCETADRVVAQSQVGDGVMVSTVFLGIDHNFAFDGPPILFETMIFQTKEGGAEMLDDYQERYRTWGEAEAGHARAVAMVKEALAR